MTTDDGTLKNPCHRAAPRPPSEGLYDPRFEHDACGVAFVADLQGRRSHQLVLEAISALEHLAHRGATGSEEDSGDGAGILVQVPHEFYAAVVPFDLPEPGGYATGLAFLSRDPQAAASARNAVEKLADDEGLIVLGWRDLPVDDSSLGSVSNAARPAMHQIFVAGKPGVRIDGPDRALALDRLAFVLRKRAEHQVDGVLLRVALGADHHLQGDADLPPAAPSSSRTSPTSAW